MTPVRGPLKVSYGYFTVPTRASVGKHKYP